MKKRMKVLIKLMCDQLDERASDCYEAVSYLEDIAGEIESMKDRLEALEKEEEALDDVDPDDMMSVYDFWITG